MENHVDRPLLSLRSALVFLLAALSGAAAGALSWLAGESVPRGVLACLAVTGLSIPFFDRLIASGDTAPACEKAHDHG